MIEKMRDVLKDSNVELLIDALLTLETKEECENFLLDLCTITELKSISQRLAVAKMLSEKQVYSNIVKETKASTATISRVNRSLNYGENGYQVVFDRLNEK